VRRIFRILAITFGFTNTAWLAFAFYFNWFPQPLESNQLVRALEFLFALFQLTLIGTLGRDILKETRDV